jgi:hypothetical protein
MRLDRTDWLLRRAASNTFENHSSENGQNCHGSVTDHGNLRDRLSPQSQQLWFVEVPSQLGISRRGAISVSGADDVMALWLLAASLKVW